MVKYAAFILTIVVSCACIPAFADDTTDQKRVERARKLLASLEKYGINSSEVKSLAGEINDRMDNKGAIHLSDNEVPGGTLSFNYAPQSVMPSGRQFELRYIPKHNDHINVVAHTNSIMLLYHKNFSTR